MTSERRDSSLGWSADTTVISWNWRGSAREVSLEASIARACRLGLLPNAGQGRRELGDVFGMLTPSACTHAARASASRSTCPR